MKHTLEQINPSKIKITVDVDPKAWKDAQDKAFEKVSADIKVDGFRPGKAPKAMLASRVNPSALFDEAINSLLTPVYAEVIAEEKVEPFLQPQVDVTKVSDAELQLVYTLVLMPICELGKYTDLGLKKAAAKVTAKEVNEAINARLENNAMLETVERAAKMGDTVIFDFVGKTANEAGEMEAFEGGSADNYSLELGSGQFVPGFEEGLVGVKSGDVKEVEVTFPEQYVEALAGKKAVFTCTVHEIKAKKVAKLTDEAVKELAVMNGEKAIETVADLKAFEKENLLKAKVNEIENAYYADIIKAIVKDSKFTIADEIVEAEERANLDNLKKQIEQNGLTYEQYLEITGAKEEDILKTFHEQATENIKAFLALDAVAVAGKVEVTDADLEKEAETVAEMYGIKKEDVLSYMGQDKARWMGQIRDRKVKEFLLANNAPKAAAKKTTAKKPAAKKTTAKKTTTKKTTAKKTTKKAAETKKEEK